MYRRSVNQDYPESVIDDRREYSQDDKKFLNLMNESKTQVDGHYELCLPIRNSDVKLPDNKVQAQQRLCSLQKKLTRDAQFHNHYKDFMNSCHF